MVNDVSSNRPDFRGEVPNSRRVKPNQQPRNDNFRKAYKDSRLSKEEEEFASVEEKDHDSPPPSLFDLSKKTPTKGKPSLARSSTLKNSLSDSDTMPNRPLSSKQGAIGQEPGLFPQENETELADSEVPQQPIEDGLFAANDKLPVTHTQDEMPLLEDSQEGVETPLPQKTSQPPQLPAESKKPQDQAQLTDAINRQHGALQHPQRPKKSEDSSFETKETSSVSKKDKSKGEARSSQASDQEKVDAAAVNSNIQSVAFQTEKAEANQEVASSATIKDLANQIIEHIQVMRKEDQTSTMITLRHPPILEGATITLTTSDHAKREFNISFANLSPEAKLFLDRKLNEDSLTQTLERKGIVVHMVTTTTQAENLLNVDAAGQAFRDRQDQQQQQQQQQQRRQQFQEDETE